MKRSGPRSSATRNATRCQMPPCSWKIRNSVSRADSSEPRHRPRTCRVVPAALDSPDHTHQAGLAAYGQRVLLPAFDGFDRRAALPTRRRVACRVFLLLRHDRGQAAKQPQQGQGESPERQGRQTPSEPDADRQAGQRPRRVGVARLNPERFPGDAPSRRRRKNPALTYRPVGEGPGAVRLRHGTGTEPQGGASSCCRSTRRAGSQTGRG